jgi:hypothetical protein
MNEKQLKHLFCSALRSGHIKNNSVIPTPEEAELRVIEEAHFRGFDLLIAAITNEPCVLDYDDMLVRTRLLECFAKSEKCRIDCIRFYPIEIKSDGDSIDERLPNQIIDAILTFGVSILVLDENHARKVRSSRLDRFLPATVISYTGIDDHFEVISTFDRFVSGGAFSIQKTSLARLLAAHGDIEIASRAHTRLAMLERLLQKLAFSQLYYENLSLEEEELEFLHRLAGVCIPNNRKMITRLIKETVNNKLTDYM